MSLLSKQEQQDLIKRLYQARQTAELQAMRKLLGHRLEETKADLVGCQVEAFPRLQGAALAYRGLLEDLERKIPDLPTGPLSNAGTDYR
jgi:hypothetical protein